jgi:hypothetical protein
MIQSSHEFSAIPAMPKPFFPVIYEVLKGASACTVCRHSSRSGALLQHFYPANRPLAIPGVVCKKSVFLVKSAGLLAHVCGWQKVRFMDQEKVAFKVLIG